MKKPVIICVDDQRFFLQSLKNEIIRSFADKVIVEIAEYPKESLDIIDGCISKGLDIPIFIADYLMPEMLGDELLKIVHEKLPNTKKILLTGQSTMEGVANAIHWAKLYRYISKPWESTDLKLTIAEAFRIFFKEKLIEIQYKYLNDLNKKMNFEVQGKVKELNMANEENFKELVISSLSVIIEYLYKAYPSVLDRFKRLHVYIQCIINNAFSKQNWDLEAGFLVLALFFYNQPENIIKEFFFAGKFNNTYIKKFEELNKEYYELINKIPIFDIIAKKSHDQLMMYFQNTTNQTNTKEFDKLFEILNLAIIFDNLVLQGLTKSEILETIRFQHSFREEYLMALSKLTFTQAVKGMTVSYNRKGDTDNTDSSIIVPIQSDVQALKLKNLKVGMILAREIQDKNGNQLVPGGIEVYGDLLHSLVGFVQHDIIKEPIFVYVS